MSATQWISSRGHLFALSVMLVLSVRASLPEHLSNFVNEYVCDSNVRLVRPQTVSDVEEAVKRHDHVKAVGTGHSWNKFFCAPPPQDTDTSANIVMTTIRPLVIDVNEGEMSVWVSAGVTVWNLMEYLGNYKTQSAPLGYALGATPIIVNQTIAGAVATQTHASSLTHGSLSNQVIGFRVILANGTTTEIYPDNYPLYFKAFQVNVGRLGVVTHVKMRIIKEPLIKRTLYPSVPREVFLPKIRSIQEMYESTGELPAWADGLMFLLHPQDFSYWVFTIRETETYQSSSKSSDADVDHLDENSHDYLESYLRDRINAPINFSRADGGLDIADGVSWEEPTPRMPNLDYVNVEDIPKVIQGDTDAYASIMGNNTVTQRAALTYPFLAFGENPATFDDYEISIPVDKMADCIEGMNALLDSQAPEIGFRRFTYFRFVGKETGLLSVANEKPRLWIACHEWLYYNREGRQSNIPFKRLIAYLVTSPLCSTARFHWGKSAWPDPGCWHGAEVFPDTWCDFGCAVRDLDPHGKFIGGIPEVWNWEGADLDKCCTSDGYDKSISGCDCAVARQRHPDECPNAPFYSYR